MQIGDVVAVLQRLEAKIDALMSQHENKPYYSVEEVAQILGKAPFTVRGWARNGRIAAEKRPCGRGLSREWMISREELIRLRSEGLLPEKAGKAVRQF